MKHFTLIFSLLWSLSSLAQYEPVAKDELIKHTFYQLDYNEQHEQPSWVYYVLTKGNVFGKAKRKNNFKADHKVSTESAQLSDYRGSGYDRGHLCPAADMKQSQTAMGETFLMSNMSPQVASFNRGIWVKCESQIRRLLNDTLYVVTGPIFKDNIGTVGANEVTVPGAYYKVAYDGKDKMYAYVIPHKGSSAELSIFEVSVDSVEVLTGIDFFYQLPDELENELEK